LKSSLQQAAGNALAVSVQLKPAVSVVSKRPKALRSELDGEHAFPGKGRLKPQDEELRRLKRENERLRRERDILKKAVAIFSKDPHRYSGS